MNVQFPYAIDGRGRTAESADPAWVRGLIEQVLFTAPGERVMRPDFGSGVMQLVFAPNSAELAATLQVLVQGALQHWLSSIIEVEEVAVFAEESVLRVTVTYVIRRTRSRHTNTMTHGSTAP